MRGWVKTSQPEATAEALPENAITVWWNPMTGL